MRKASTRRVIATIRELAPDFRNKPLRLADVAARVGASIATVSRRIGGATGLRKIASESAAPATEAPQVPVAATPKVVAPIESRTAAAETVAAPRALPSPARLVAKKPVPVDEIRRAAYFRWVDRGCPQSDGLEDWLAAEAELRQAA
jgi:hypothetical protein